MKHCADIEKRAIASRASLEVVAAKAVGRDNLKSQSEVFGLSATFLLGAAAAK
jgi:hypothetical protein